MILTIYVLMDIPNALGFDSKHIWGFDCFDLHLMRAGHGWGPSGKVLACPFIHKSPLDGPLLLHDKCLIVLFLGKISLRAPTLIKIILPSCGTLLLLQSQ